MAKRLLLISTSTVHGSGYLDYCADALAKFLSNGTRVLFIPYARPSGISHAEYTELARERFARLGLELVGVNETARPLEAIQSSQSLFIGGGNTFLLLRDLYTAGLLDTIRQRVAAGIPYVGTSAGSNVAGLTIGTTNDMPIVLPPSIDALGLVPFNINPHYLDPDLDSTHKGETRETRINEFHVINEQPVVGLREGAWLHVNDGMVQLAGDNGARLFRQGLRPEEYRPGSRLDFLLEPC
jgi:dipeptidase E